MIAVLLKTWPILVCASVYFIQAGMCAYARQWGLAVNYFGVGLANVGMIPVVGAGA